MGGKTQNITRVPHQSLLIPLKLENGRRSNTTTFSQLAHCVRVDKEQEIQWVPQDSEVDITGKHPRAVP